MKVKLTLLALACLLVSASTSAAPLTITNPGFEDLYFGGNLPAAFNGDVPPTAFPFGNAPAGWALFGTTGGGTSIGVLNPGVMAIEPMATNFPAGAPEGDNVALLFFNNFAGGAEFGIQQTLADTLQPRTTYTLSVEVGNIASGTSVVEPFASFGFFDLRGFPGYRIDLLAGGTVLASDNSSLLPGEGEFLTSTIQVDIGDVVVPGQALSIRLVNLNVQDVNDPAVDLEVDFDDIRLDASPLISADFDEDADVDGRDFLIWQVGFGGGPLLSEGNADGDTDVDGDDLAIWEQRFVALPPILAATTSIPEPSALLLLGSALIGMLSKRWRVSADAHIACVKGNVDRKNKSPECFVTSKNWG